jgi:hypothetical protein
VALMPNALAALYSYGDGLKRKMNRLISDPAGTVDLGSRRFNEDQNALQNLFANAFPIGGDKTVLNGPQQVAQFQGEATDKAMEMYGGLMGATVWHGSPHAFSKFDSGKIGTGEGAQAYGHGLYLADAPETAMSYRASVQGGGPQFGLEDGPTKGIATLIAARGKSGEQMARKAYAELGDQLEPTIAKARQAVHAQSSLYKVDLPDEHIAKMLDWDKPLSQQAPEVQKVLKTYKGAQWWMLNKGTMGDELVRKIQGKNPQEFSSAMKDMGVPGIRYLDGGSRGAGGGTSNYVVFPGNENLLQILERNGQSIK